MDLAVFFVASLTLAGACEIGYRGGLGSPDRRSLEIAQRREAILERLIPEDGLSGSKRRVLVEATAIVIKDVDKSELRESFSKTRSVLKKASLEDLERIEALLPEIREKLRDRN